TSVAGVVVLHRGNADYCCRINGVMPVRDRCQMKDWVIFNRCIKSGMIAKRPLWAHLPGLNITLQNKVNVRRHLEIDCFAANELDCFFPQKTRKQDFIQTIRKWRSRCERISGIAAESDCHWLALRPRVLAL